ncbi:hypothetical protein BurJ1DRAFT_2627 [Burkholderiales bacterium JOSHI_001]|nr:hypothetical protein BurJ1DRAFT_2627 [Burkholderiales bacterium JOSHI_001]
MAKIVLYDVNIGDVMKRNFAGPAVGMEEAFAYHPFKVDLEVTDEEFHLISDNQRAIEEIYEAANPKYQDMVSGLLAEAARLNGRLAEVHVEHLTERNALAQPQRDLPNLQQALNGNWSAAFQARATDTAAAIRTAAQAVIRTRVRDWKTAKSDAGTYLRKQTLGMTLGVAALGANIASLCAPDPTLVSKVFAILGMAKTLAKLYEEGSNLYHDIDALIPRLNRFAAEMAEDCEQIKKRSKSGAFVVHAKHVLVDAVAEATGGVSSVFKVMPASLKQFQADLEFFSGKLARIKANMEAFNTELNKYLDEQQAYDQALEKMGLMVAPSAASTGPRWLMKARDGNGLHLAQELVVDAKMAKMFEKTNELIELQLLTYQRLMGSYDYDRASRSGQRVQGGTVTGLSKSEPHLLHPFSSKAETVTKHAGLEALESHYKDIAEQAASLEKSSKSTAVLMGLADALIASADMVANTATSATSGPVSAGDVVQLVFEGAIEIGKLVNESVPLPQ